MNIKLWVFALLYTFTAFALEDFEENLKNQHYHLVDFPVDYSTIEKAVEAYQIFLQLPKELKNHIKYKFVDKTRRSDVGYFCRKSEGTHYDDKEFFHFHPSIYKKCPEFLSQYPEVFTFCEYANQIWEAAVSVVEEQLQLLEQRYPGVYGKHLDTDSPQVYLRFLQYHPKGDKDELAKGHYDAGSMTLAIAESGPGLRIADSNGKMQLIRHMEGQAIFFLGSTFQKMMEDNYFSPAWHDVVRVHKNKNTGSANRWAVVCFFNAIDQKNNSWEENHRKKL